MCISHLCKGSKTASVQPISVMSARVACVLSTNTIVAIRGLSENAVIVIVSYGNDVQHATTTSYAFQLMKIVGIKLLNF